jgi:hypothetical protein
MDLFPTSIKKFHLIINTKITAIEIESGIKIGRSDKTGVPVRFLFLAPPPTTHLYQSFLQV